MGKIITIIGRKIIQMLQDHVAMLLIYLVDKLGNVIYSDIADFIHHLADNKDKKLDKVLFDFHNDDEGNFVNEKLRKKMIGLINKGYVNCGERFLFISEKGYNYYNRWIRPQCYKDLTMKIMQKIKEKEDGQTTSTK